MTVIVIIQAYKIRKVVNKIDAANTLVNNIHTQGSIYWGGQGGSFPPKYSSFPPKTSGSILL